MKFRSTEQLLSFVRLGTLLQIVREAAWESEILHTLWVILVHPNSTFFVARNDGQLLIRKEKVGGGYAAPVGVLRQNNQFVWIFLHVRSTRSAKDLLKLEAIRNAPGRQQTRHSSRHRQ